MPGRAAMRRSDSAPAAARSARGLVSAKERPGEETVVAGERVGPPPGPPARGASAGSAPRSSAVEPPAAPPVPAPTIPSTATVPGRPSGIASGPRRAPPEDARGRVAGDASQGTPPAPSPAGSGAALTGRDTARPTAPPPTAGVLAALWTAADAGRRLSRMTMPAADGECECTAPSCGLPMEDASVGGAGLMRSPLALRGASRGRPTSTVPGAPFSGPPRSSRCMLPRGTTRSQVRNRAAAFPQRQ
jgi:hypothetical protein